MHRFTAQFQGTSLSQDGQAAARLSCKQEDIPQPGQAVLACNLDDPQPFRKTIFPIQNLSDGFVADIPPEPQWRIREAFSLWGPLGSGFTPPAGTQKWLLASFEYPPRRLFSLIQSGLDKGVAISLCTAHLPPYLPPQVEWIPEISEALLWADYLALDLPAEAIPSLRSMLGFVSDEKLPFFSQILISQPMPCGMGVCYACALKGIHGITLACMDGPVFRLDQLEF